MTKKLILVIAVVVLAICLVSGGCSPPETDGLNAWKDLIKLPENETVNDESPPEADEQKEKEVSEENQGSIDIKLYFGKPDGNGLVAETRSVTRTQAIARLTVEELIKGPQTPEYLGVIPEGSRLLDINVKPDGICIVDLSSEIRNVDNAHQEKLMVYALANTLAQFPTVDSISVMIEGKQVDSIAGYLELTDPIKPDYDF